MFEPETEQRDVGNGWIRVVESKCGFQLEHFMEVMELILREPNIMSPSILRAEILEETEIHEYKQYIRKLVPKQDRDPFLSQFVKDFGIQVVHWTECPIDELPYFYPKFKSFRYCFEDEKVAINVQPFPELLEMLQDKRYNTIWTRILKMIHKFSTGTINGFEKNVHHDLIVPRWTFKTCIVPSKTPINIGWMIG
jgi:hypothetical protein